MQSVEVRTKQKSLSKYDSPVRRFFFVFIQTLVWAFVAAAVLGSLAAAIWTVIPTEMLDWGSSQVNLIGYVSHCNFVPLSTTILLVVAIIGLLLTIPLRSSRHIGAGVFAGSGVGLAFGMLGGFDIIMFIGMGSGIGIGILLGILIGMMKGREET